MSPGGHGCTDERAPLTRPQRGLSGEDSEGRRGLGECELRAVTCSGSPVGKARLQRGEHSIGAGAQAGAQAGGCGGRWPGMVALVT